MKFFNNPSIYKIQTIEIQNKKKRVIFTLGADLRAALVANCLRGAFPPVDFRAVCFVRAIVIK